MSSFSIYGTCVCRDIFGIADTDQKHKVDIFLQASSQYIQFKLGSIPRKKITDEVFRNGVATKVA